MIIIAYLTPVTLKAVIMAGGQGTRGRPFTEYFPKAMIPISDKPLVDYIIRYVKSFEFIDQIIVITDLAGLGGQIQNYYGADAPFCNSDGVVFVQDSQSGTGGDLLHICGMIPSNEPFVLWFADNLCAVDLAGMLEHFYDKNSYACIATRSTRAEETGFAIVDDNGIVCKFVEKPIIKLPSSECLGVYVLHYDVLSRIRDAMQQKINQTASVTCDFTATDCNDFIADSKKAQVNLSHDILEDLSKKGAISAFDIGNSQWLDVESPVILERNKVRVDEIISVMNNHIMRDDSGNNNDHNI